MRAEFGDAEAGHRLVKQQQLRFGRECDGKFELALFAVAEFGHRHVGAFREPYPRQRRLRRVAEWLLLARAGPEAEGMPVMGLGCERNVVGSRKVRQQTGDLERARQPEPAALIGRQPGDVAAGKMNRAGIRHQLPGQLADQRGLAGAVRADDGVQFA